MPSLFARRRDSSPAAVSKILRQLGDKGLILTAIADGDGRQRRYSLTSKGKRAMERLREMREEAIRRVWLELDGAGMRAFAAFGGQLVESLERYASSSEQGTRARTTKTGAAHAEVDPPAGEKE
jgi:DNA-binding MarR family transcriptional regulator